MRAWLPNRPITVWDFVAYAIVLAALMALVVWGGR